MLLHLRGTPPRGPAGGKPLIAAVRPGNVDVAGLSALCSSSCRPVEAAGGENWGSGGGCCGWGGGGVSSSAPQVAARPSRTSASSSRETCTVCMSKACMQDSVRPAHCACAMLTGTCMQDSASVRNTSEEGSTERNMGQIEGMVQVHGRTHGANASCDMGCRPVTQRQTSDPAPSEHAWLSILVSPQGGGCPGYDCTLQCPAGLHVYIR